MNGNPQQQGSTKAQLTSNIDEIALFFSGTNPHLTTDAVRTLFITHIDRHVAQINKFQDKDYTGEEKLWPAMVHHICFIADMPAAALVKQFPKRFT